MEHQTRRGRSEANVLKLYYLPKQRVERLMLLCQTTQIDMIPYLKLPLIDFVN